MFEDTQTYPIPDYPNLRLVWFNVEAPNPLHWSGTDVLIIQAPRMSGYRNFDYLLRSKPEEWSEHTHEINKPLWELQERLDEAYEHVTSKTTKELANVVCARINDKYGSNLQIVKYIGYGQSDWLEYVADVEQTDVQELNAWLRGDTYLVGVQRETVWVEPNSGRIMTTWEHVESDLDSEHYGDFDPIAFLANVDPLVLADLANPNPKNGDH